MWTFVQPFAVHFKARRRALAASRRVSQRGPNRLSADIVYGTGRFGIQTPYGPEFALCPNLCEKRPASRHGGLFWLNQPASLYRQFGAVDLCAGFVANGDD